MVGRFRGVYREEGFESRAGCHQGGKANGNRGRRSASISRHEGRGWSRGVSQLVPVTLNYRRHNRADTASAPLGDGYRRSPSCAFSSVVIDTVFRPVIRVHT